MAGVRRPSKKQNSDQRQILWRLSLVFLTASVFVSVLLVRAFSVQVLPNPRLEKLAARQYHSNILLRPRRGLILDRNGEALAVNIESKSLAANPQQIKNPEGLADRLAPALRVRRNYLLRKLKSSRSFVWLNRHLSEKQINALKKRNIIGEGWNLPSGLWLVSEDQRAYPHSRTAGPLLGSVNVDADGLEGLELHFDEYLSGTDVRTQAGRDALGRRTFFDLSALNNLSDGKSITLSLDLSLQFQVEDILKRAVDKWQALDGVAVVMDAESGEILALANDPSFDPNASAKRGEARRNRVFTDAFEPGSTMKPLLMASALMNDWKSDQKIFGENGSFKIGGRTISEAESHEKFQWITLKEMVAKSSNVVAAKLAVKIGAETYLSVLKEFGLGSKTQVRFPGEISGRLPETDQVTPLTLANLGFGQALLVTPIQVVRAYAALANGGWLVTPRIVLHPIQGKELLRKRVVDPDTSHAVEDALSLVIKEGSGKLAAVPGYDIVGKTGTAQVVDPKTKAYSSSHYVSSFVGYSRNISPNYVIFVAINRPRGDYYASKVAAPVFAEIFRAVARRFSIPSGARVVQASAHAGNDQITSSQAKPASPQSQTSPLQMPDLQGLTLREAMLEISKTELGEAPQLQVKGQGLVEHQSPSPGTPLQNLKRISLRLKNRE